MRIEYFYYCIVYFLHIRALGNISSMEDKSIIKVNEVKEHLLNKDKIDTQLTDKSHLDDSGKFIIQGRRVIMEVTRVTQNIRI